MLQDLGDWRTPQFQAPLFHTTQTNLICSPKDWKSKTCSQVPLHSYLSFWSPNLLSRGAVQLQYSSLESPCICSRHCHSRLQLPVLGPGAAEDCCSWPCRGSSMGPGAHWVHMSKLRSQKKRRSQVSAFPCLNLPAQNFVHSGMVPFPQSVPSFFQARLADLYLPLPPCSKRE